MVRTVFAVYRQHSFLLLDNEQKIGKSTLYTALHVLGIMGIISVLKNVDFAVVFAFLLTALGWMGYCV